MSVNPSEGAASRPDMACRRSSHDVSVCRPVIGPAGRSGRCHGFRPVAQEQVTERHQTIGFTGGLKLLATECVAKRRPGKAGLQ
jgi:hypothetical protein